MSRLTVLSGSFVDLSYVILVILVFFLEPHRAVTTLRNLLVWLELSNESVFFIPRCEKVRFFLDSKHAARVILGVAHAQRNIAQARKCHELLLRLKCFLHISFHPVLSPAGNVGNECADIAASLGIKSIISESDVSTFWPDRFFCAARF